MSAFPDGYPEDLLDRILKNGGEFKEYHDVYRVAKYGLNDPRSFYSTIQEKILESNGALRPNESKKKPALSDYSTSLSTSVEKMAAYLQHSEQNHPKATIIIGYTKKEFGPTKLNVESKHIHWWLYKGAEPWRCFRAGENLL